jgi:hypothetical protein
MVEDWAGVGEVSGELGDCRRFCHIPGRTLTIRKLGDVRLDDNSAGEDFGDREG